MIKKLLDTAKKSGNTKVAKTGAKHSPLGDVRMAQLSMMPDNICALAVKPLDAWMIA